jgi:multiple sugar transport system ATP-binding protein
VADVLLRNLTKVYAGGVRALDAIDLRAPGGRCTVVLGPSGCGKSTMLRLIAGLEKVSGGEIAIGEQRIERLPPSRRGVAMLVQDFPLYPHMRVRENLACAVRSERLGRDEVERRISLAAELLALGTLLDRRPGELSGGERQRVALGRVLVRQPRCALFDEPLSNLDASLRSRIRAELKAIQQRAAITTIHVTHDQDEAMALADTLAVMAGGRIQQCGPPLEAYHRPANRFVAGFLGRPAMNFIDGWIEIEAGEPAFTDRRGFCITLPGRELRAMNSRPCVLGVRPEHVRLVDGSNTTRGDIAASVRFIEKYGDSAVVRLAQTAGPSLCARLRDADEITTGRGVGVRFDPQWAHLFEPGEFGRAINHGRPAAV